jgi:DNA topoisomerase I
MKLVIVESPTKAHKIGHILGNNYKIMSSLGHICDITKNNKYGIGIDIENNFKPKYELIENKIELLQSIINEAEKSDEIILLSDYDREGMAIAYHIKRYLSSTNKPIKIGFLKEITEKGIKSSINSLSDIDMNLFHSQEARRILDRIVGFMVSPYLINFYGANLSAGRVQSVVVRMIADREKSIETFKPEEYWNIHGKFKTEKNEQFVMKYRDKLTDKNSAEVIFNSIKDQKEFYVSSVSNQKKKEKPCAPLITASLQQYMAKKYNFDPERTMKAAQNLYENGFCSYIRTDSTRISDEAIESVRNWLKENEYNFPKKPNIFKTKNTAQDAHECIRPTNVKNLPDKSILTGDEKEVYVAIWKHFVACQMDNAIWNTMHVSVCARMNAKIVFTASGKALDYEGYLKMFSPIDPGKIEMPNLTEGMIVNLIDENSVKLEQKFTQPPARYNDVSLLEDLESKQIGRPATTADIIKKITSRNYVEKIGTTYRPTELGKKITDILVNLFSFMEYKYTSFMEEQLDEIAAGNLSSVNMLKEFFIPFKKKLDEAYIKSGAILCEKCKSIMVKRINSKNQSEFMACSNFPRCHNTFSINNKNVDLEKNSIS